MLLPGFAIPEDILKKSSEMRDLKQRLKSKPRLANGIEAHKVFDTKQSGTDVGLYLQQPPMVASGSRGRDRNERIAQIWE